MLEQLLKTINVDKSTTWLGFILAGIITMKLDWAKVMHADPSECGTLAGAFVTLTITWLIGKAGKTPPAAAAILALLLFGAATAVQAQTITITVTTPKSTASAKINVFSAPTITALSCSPADVLEGDPISCSITVDKPAPPVGYRLAIVYGAPFPGAPTEFMIGPGQIKATITFPAPSFGVPIVAADVPRNFFIWPLQIEDYSHPLQQGLMGNLPTWSGIGLRVLIQPYWTAAKS